MNMSSAKTRIDGLSKGASPNMMAIIDGSNAAHQGGWLPTLRHLMAVIEGTKHNYEKVLTITDADLRYKIDDKRGYEKHMNARRIEQSPAGISADIVIVEIAKKMALQAIERSSSYRTILGLRERFPPV